MFSRPHNGTTRFIIEIVLLTLSVLLVLFAVLSVVPALGAPPGPNQAAYWEDKFEHTAFCFKHDGNSAHGSVTNNGTAVTLNVFNQSWPGDHWEALIIKGGSVDNGFGPGNVVYVHPSAGVPYFAPLNAGGQQSGVSHWIVCKGDTPEQTTTTTSTIPETTTTTVPETTTTTVPETTTTTVPETTTTTIPETTTTTVPETTTTTVPETTTTTQPPTTTTQPPSTTTTTQPPACVERDGTWVIDSGPDAGDPCFPFTG